MYKLDTPEKAEYPILLEIWEASVRATHHFLSERDIQFYKNIIHDNGVFSMVQLTTIRDKSNNEILGFMGITENRLEMIFLHPAARGKGLGKALLKHAIEDLKVTRVDVNEQNENALRFYEHTGFKVTSRSPLDGTGKPYPILHMALINQHTGM